MDNGFVAYKGGYNEEDIKCTKINWGDSNAKFFFPKNIIQFLFNKSKVKKVIIAHVVSDQCYSNTKTKSIDESSIYP